MGPHGIQEHLSISLMGRVMCLGQFQGDTHKMELRRRVLENKKNIMINIYYLSAPFNQSYQCKGTRDLKADILYSSKRKEEEFFCGKPEEKNIELVVR